MLIKMGPEFFQDIRIKKLRTLENGDTLVYIYLKLLLLAAETQGAMEYTKVERSFERELSLKLDEDEKNIHTLLEFLGQHHAFERYDDVSACGFLPIAVKIISESSTERMRKHRNNKAAMKIAQSYRQPKCDSKVTLGDNGVTLGDAGVTERDSKVTPVQIIPNKPMVIEVLYDNAVGAKS